VTAPTPEALAEAINHALGLVDTLAGDWALIDYDSRYPAGRNPDRPTRARPINQADPDHVKAERDDPGIGDYRARQACSEASRHIAIAHRLAVAAVVSHTTARPTQSYQRPPRSAVDVRAVLAATEGRLKWLQQQDLDPDTRQTVHGAASALIAAHAALRAVMADYDHVGEPTLDRRCWNCLRAVDPPRRECEACRKYRARAEAAIRAGKKPPHRLRPVPRYDDAHKARQRREARLKPGQLDIEGPVPTGNWIDGTWTPATPHPPSKEQAS
jgi:hypothetical protein